jgi:choloylglycine hydrolase
MHQRRGFVFKNYDWHRDYGWLVVNPAGIAKLPIIDLFYNFPSNLMHTSATWVSRYASITYLQHGIDYPLGGMNEKGLVVETNILPETQYPVGNKNAIHELGLVQYLLDNAASIDQALEYVQKLTIIPNSAKLHFFVCEASGRCLIIEYLNGKVITQIHTNTDAAVMTNSVVKQEQARSLKVTEDPSIDNAPNSSVRFAIARDLATIDANLNPVEYGMNELLYRVTQHQNGELGDRTMIRIGYDLSNRRMYYATRSRQVIQSVDFRDLDLKTVRVLDMGGKIVSNTLPPQEEQWQRNLAISTERSLDWRPLEQHAFRTFVKIGSQDAPGIVNKFFACQLIPLVPTVFRRLCLATESEGSILVNLKKTFGSKLYEVELPLRLQFEGTNYIIDKFQIAADGQSAKVLLRPAGWRYYFTKRSIDMVLPEKITSVDDIASFLQKLNASSNC